MNDLRSATREILPWQHKANAHPRRRRRRGTAADAAAAATDANTQ